MSDELPEGYVTDKEMLETLMRSGVSRTDATMALELANHAKKQALETVHTVAQTAPLHLVSLVAGLGIENLAATLSLENTQALSGMLLRIGTATASMNKEAKG